MMLFVLGYGNRRHDVQVFAGNDGPKRQNYLQQNPLPADEAGLADMQPLPAVTHLEEREMPFVIDSVAFDQLVLGAFGRV